MDKKMRPKCAVLLSTLNAHSSVDPLSREFRGIDEIQGNAGSRSRENIRDNDERFNGLLL